MSNQNIKHYLLSDEAVAKLSPKFGQYIMTKSGLLYIDLDENTRIQLGGSGGSSTGESYTKEEIDALIAELENELTAVTSGLEWKPAVDTYEDIATTYPEPADGWTVNTKDKDETWRYTGTEWVLISANSIPIATVDLDGLLSKEDKARIDSLSTEVLSKISESEDGNLLFNGEEIKGGSSVEVDTELSGSSENPVQNKVIYNELQNLKLNAIKETKVAYVNHQYTRTEFESAGTDVTVGYTGSRNNLVVAAFMYRESTLNKINGFDSWTYLGTSHEEQELITSMHDYPQNVDYFYKFIDGTEDSFTWSVNLDNSWTASLFIEFKNADTPFWREDLRQELNSQGTTVTLDKKTDNCVLFGTNVMYFNEMQYSWNISSSNVRQIPAAAEQIPARISFIIDNNENALPFTIVNPVPTDNAGESFCGIEIPAKEVIKGDNIYFAPTLYSTEEKCIGSWVDGKPLYQKTINFNPTIEIKASSTIDMSFMPEFALIDTIIKASALRTDEASEFGYGTAAVALGVRKSNESTMVVYTYTSYSNINFITIQYTKTTDAENSFIDEMVKDYLPIEGSGGCEDVTDAEIEAAIREDASFVGELPEEEIITEEQINQAIEEDKI